MQRILPVLLLLAGLAVSATAAYYSIFGLAKLFAGAATQVIIMASVLEVAKLVIASTVYRFWTALSKVLRAYLISAVTILIIITSLGVYGFLSSAYEQTSSVDKIESMKTARIETSIAKFQTLKEDYTSEKNRTLEDINKLRVGVTTILNSSETNNAINNASQNRKLVNKQLEDAIKSRDQLEIKITVASDSLFKYEGLLIEAKAQSSQASELGPLKYLSRLSGVEMDRIVNWFILLLVLVFDPLAIALLITSSSILIKLNEKGSKPQTKSSTKVVLSPISLPVLQEPIQEREEQETLPPDDAAETELVDEESISEVSDELPIIEDIVEKPDIYQDTPVSNPSFSQLKAMTPSQRLDYIKRKLWQR